MYKYTFSNTYSHTDIERHIYFSALGIILFFTSYFLPPLFVRPHLWPNFLSLFQISTSTLSQILLVLKTTKCFLHSYSKLNIHLKYFLLPNQHYDYIFFTFLSTSGSCYNFLRGRKKVGHLSCLVSSAIRVCKRVFVRQNTFTVIAA